jgi:hypothetical protein
MTRASHKRRGHGGKQNETMNDNFSPLEGVAHAAQNVQRLSYVGTR